MSPCTSVAPELLLQLPIIRKGIIIDVHDEAWSVRKCKNICDYSNVRKICILSNIPSNSINLKLGLYFYKDTNYLENSLYMIIFTPLNVQKTRNYEEE